MKASYVFIIRPLRSSKGSSATFLLKGQIKPESMFKLVSLNYRTAYIYKADKIQTQYNS